MNPRESLIDFSVFALHKQSYKVVEKIKADGLRSILPLALGALGLSLLIVSHLAKAGEPLTLDQAPLEIRARNLYLRDAAADRVWENPLDLGDRLPGRTENARWKVGLEALALNPQGWRIDGSQAHVLVDQWKFDSELLSRGFGLKLECHNADISFLPPQIDLPWPQDLKLRVGASQGKLLLSPSWDVERWADQALRPYFAPSAIERNVHLAANCPGGSEELFERLLQARLKDFPDKDPETFERSVRQLASAVRTGVDRQLKAVLPDAPAGLGFETTLALSREADGTLVFRPEGTGDFLTPEARSLVRPLPGSAASIEIILSPAALNRLVLLGMSALAEKNGGGFDGNRVFFNLDKEFPAQQFSPYIPELARLEPNARVKARLVLPVRADNPSVKPWISAGGLSGGLDLSWLTRLELLSAADGEVRATRSFAMELTFEDLKNASGAAGWKYAGGRWLQDAQATDPAPLELGLTIDWALNSPLFRGFMEKQLEGALSWRGAGGQPKFRRVGRALGLTRRAAGGYFAEALVIDLHPGF